MNLEIEDEDDLSDKLFDVRAKGIMDGAKTFDEAITQVREFADYLQSLKDEGYELTGVAYDDYAMYAKPEDGIETMDLSRH